MRNHALLCILENKKCAEKNCEHEHRSCICDFNPLLKQPQPRRQRKTAQTSLPVRMTTQSLSDPVIRESLIYPNGYCRYTSGTPVKALRCYYKNLKCSERADICIYQWTPCNCDHNPFPILPEISQSPQPIWPNGKCTMSHGPKPQLTCHFKRRKCDNDPRVCRFAAQPCICTYDPRIEVPIEKPRRRPGIQSEDEQPRKKPNPEGQSQSETYGSLGARDILQTVCRTIPEL